MRALRSFLKSFHFLTITIFSCFGLIFFLGLIDLPTNQSLREAKASFSGVPPFSLVPPPDDFSGLIRDGFMEIRGIILEGDTLATSFKRNKVPHTTSSQIFTSLKQVINLNHLRPGDRYSIIFEESGKLVRSVYEISPLESYTVKLTDDGYLAERNRFLLEKRTVRITGEVDSSLFSAFPDNIKSPKLVYTFADIFASKIDFNTETRKGDNFALIVDEYYLFDDFVGYGPVSAAKYERTEGEKYEAFRFKQDSGQSSYFDRDGNELRASFIRSPVRVGRVTSRFSKRRMHPILGVIRQHLGVDLAAPKGTPIMAAADGRVVQIRRNGGFGNQIILSHGGEFRTHYGHLSRFKKGLKKGDKVHQMQIIGYVGSTGLATGPHLDYRIQKNGIYKNPFSVTFRPKTTLKGKDLEELQENVLPLIPKLFAEHQDQILETTSLTIDGDQQITLL